MPPKRKENPNEVFHCTVCKEYTIFSNSRPTSWPSKIRICNPCACCYRREKKKTAHAPACPPGTCDLPLSGTDRCLPCFFQRCLDEGHYLNRGQLAVERNEENHPRDAVEELRAMLREQQQRAEAAEAAIQEQQQRAEAARADRGAQQQRADAARAESQQRIEIAEQRAEEAEQRAEEAEAANENLKRTISEQAMEISNLTAQNYELTGRVRVFCRVRPPRPSTTSTISLSNKKTIVISRPGAAKPEEFTFDQVFGSEDSQLDIFMGVSSLVKAVLDGHTTVFLAYGQTCSGKTHTMHGGEIGTHLEGLIPQCVRFLFTSLENGKGWIFQVEIAYIEVYNEEVHDLLSDVKKGQQPDGDIVSFKYMKISDMNEFGKINASAMEKRRVGGTRSNDQSSRSHCITRLRISRENDANEKFKGELFLIDLAGSEKQNSLGQDVAKGRIQESSNINQSLLELSQILRYYSQKKPVPTYRNSKLTHLLQQPFSGNTRIIILIHVSSDDMNISETINTLRFGKEISSPSALQRSGTPQRDSNLLSVPQRTISQRPNMSQIRLTPRLNTSQNNVTPRPPNTTPNLRHPTPRH